MKVTRIEHGNDDLSVVNAARVSMDKQVDVFGERDDGLVRYLASADPPHFTPFCHARYSHRLKLSDRDVAAMLSWFGNGRGTAGAVLVNCGGGSWDYSDSLWGFFRGGAPLPGKGAILRAIAGTYAPVSAKYLVGDGELGKTDWAVVGPDRSARTFLIECPIFVARQLMRSNVGIVYNEVSRRYVDTPPQFHRMDEWRARPDGSIKQGSGGALPEKVGVTCDGWEEYAMLAAQSAYRNLLASGVAPEQARAVLPQSMMTKIWATFWNGALGRFLNLRTDGHAQKEIQVVAGLIEEAL